MAVCSMRRRNTTIAAKSPSSGIFRSNRCWPQPLFIFSSSMAAMGQSQMQKGGKVQNGTKMPNRASQTNREPATIEKEPLLLAQLRRLGSVLVAFSGGADSAYLAWAAHRVLGSQALAVTALSPSYSSHDREQALSFAREANLRHEFIETSEFDNPLYVANQADRCYHCKDELFGRLETMRVERGFANVAYGVNADNIRDF